MLLKPTFKKLNQIVINCWDLWELKLETIYIYLYKGRRALKRDRQGRGTGNRYKKQVHVCIISNIFNKIMTENKRTLE